MERGCRRIDIHTYVYSAAGSGTRLAQESPQRQAESHVCLYLGQAPLGFPSPASCPFPSPDLSLIGHSSSEKKRLQTPVIPPPPPFYRWGNPTSKEWWLCGHRRAERSSQHSRSEGVAVRRYPSSKVRSSSCALLEQP